MKPIVESHEASRMPVVSNTSKERWVLKFCMVSCNEIIYSRVAVEVAPANTVSKNTVLGQTLTQNSRGKFFEGLAMSFTWLIGWWSLRLNEEHINSGGCLGRLLRSKKRELVA